MANSTRNRKAIFLEVQTERLKQDEAYGGPTHDDAHVMNDWIALITRYAGEAAARPACSKAPSDADALYFRKNMIRVAALAVAAVESIDRMRGE